MKVNLIFALLLVMQVARMGFAEDQIPVVPEQGYLPLIAVRTEDNNPEIEQIKDDPAIFRFEGRGALFRVRNDLFFVTKMEKSGRVNDGRVLVLNNSNFEIIVDRNALIQNGFQPDSLALIRYGKSVQYRFLILVTADSILYGEERGGKAFLRCIDCKAKTSLPLAIENKCGGKCPRCFARGSGDPREEKGMRFGGLGSGPVNGLTPRQAFGGSKTQ